MIENDLIQRLTPRIEGMFVRLAELKQQLSDPQVQVDLQKMTLLSRECTRLQEVENSYHHYQQALIDQQALVVMKQQLTDDEMKIMVEDEQSQLDLAIAERASALLTLLIPVDTDDEKECYLEVRAGTGGQEASLFAADLVRMYQRYVMIKGYHIDIISESPSELGGYKEWIGHVRGKGSYGLLKFESGAHRVQRVPQTEGSGRIHTSACTVAILPVADATVLAEINPKDLRIDTYRASGAGGQHVNRTESAIRITHLPSGLVVECQDERSQHKNKARALSLLTSRLHEQQKRQAQLTMSAERKSLVGSGDRSERIRTYNFPQGRVTDHRIHLTLYQLESMMAGELEVLIQPLQAEERLRQIDQMGSE